MYTTRNRQSLLYLLESHCFTEDAEQRLCYCFTYDAVHNIHISNIINRNCQILLFGDQVVTKKIPSYLNLSRMS